MAEENDRDFAADVSTQPQYILPEDCLHVAATMKPRQSTCTEMCRSLKTLVLDDSLAEALLVGGCALLLTKTMAADSLVLGGCNSFVSCQMLKHSPFTPNLSQSCSQWLASIRDQISVSLVKEKRLLPMANPEPAVCLASKGHASRCSTDIHQQWLFAPIEIFLRGPSPWELVCRYDTHVASETTMRGMLQQLERVLVALLLSADKPVGSLEIATLIYAVA